jgi:hypothetical protein
MDEIKKWTPSVKTFLRDCLFKSSHNALANDIILSLTELKNIWAA